MVKGMEEVAESWGVGGRIAWIGFALTYLLLLRASELYAEDDGKVHAVYCLRGRDVAFFVGERQVKAGDSPGVDTVEVRFKGSKGDQGRKGAVLVRTEGEGGRGWRSGGLAAGVIPDPRGEGRTPADGLP